MTIAASTLLLLALGVTILTVLVFNLRTANEGIASTRTVVNQSRARGEQALCIARVQGEALDASADYQKAVALILLAYAHDSDTEQQLAQQALVEATAALDRAHTRLQPDALADTCPPPDSKGH